MSQPLKGTQSLAWRSVRAILRTCSQGLYSIFVIALVAATAFAAYVATLDDIPVPAFVIREIRDKLETEGVRLRMEGMSFQPNGRIIVEKPSLYSPALGASLIDADLAVARINPAHLLVGQVTLEQLSLSNGRLTLPAVMTPSGLPETAVESIDFEAYRESQSWDLRYANVAIDDLQLYISGQLKQRFLQPRRPQAAKPSSLTQTILDLAPTLTRLKTELARFDGPSCLVQLEIDDARRQTAEVRLMANRIQATPTLSTGAALVEARVHETENATLEVELRSLAAPQDINASYISLQANWDQLPTAEDWQPKRVQGSASSISRGDFTIPSVVAEARPNQQSIPATVQLSLAGAPLDLKLERNRSTQETRLDLRAELAPGLPSWIAPLVRSFTEAIDPAEMAQLERTVDLSVSGTIDAAFKPLQLQAFGSTGPLTLMDAHVNRAVARAHVTGPQIDVDEILIRSGLQSARIEIGYNLDTLLRRILVEGNVDPTLINGWFKPWWAAMWEGMEFSDEGMYASLDSQAIFKRPETVRVTGIGYARDMNLRTLDVEELRTRFFSLFRYVDLYDIELQTKDDTGARGSVQFSLDRDHRDNRDKLTGLWIDAVSTLDVKRGPEVLWELEKAVTDILAPYGYDVPPRIEARSSAVRRLDTFHYDIDLGIDTDNAFRFHKFPFQSLHADVHLENGLADIPFATAGIGGGRLEASAFILGDGMDLKAELSDASFSSVLLATNTYFAADGSESAQNADRSELRDYGGTLNASFQGSGYTGNPFTYEGDGSFRIDDADLLTRHLLGPISRVLEGTPLMFTTLKFERAQGQFLVDHELVRLPEVTIDGPAAGLKMDGSYNMKQDALDIKARLFPFLNTKIPLISPIINLTTQPLMSVVELSIRGPIGEPRVSLFDGAPVERSENADPRDPRPSRR